MLRAQTSLNAAAEAAFEPARVASSMRLAIEAYLGHVHWERFARDGGIGTSLGRKMALLMLDQVRNRLLKVDVAVSTAAPGRAWCLHASVFGMNLPAPIFTRSLIRARRAKDTTLGYSS